MAENGRKIDSEERATHWAVHAVAALYELSNHALTFVRQWN